MPLSFLANHDLLFFWAMFITNEATRMNKIPILIMTPSEYTLNRRVSIKLIIWTNMMARVYGTVDLIEFQCSLSLCLSGAFLTCSYSSTNKNWPIYLISLTIVAFDYLHIIFLFNTYNIYFNKFISIKYLKIKIYKLKFQLNTIKLRWFLIFNK